MNLRVLVVLVLLSFGLVESEQQEEFANYSQPIPYASTPVEMVAIEGGVFSMGSTSGKSDELPLHEVKVGDLWVAKQEITWEQYEAFVFKREIREPYADRELLKKYSIDGITGATTPYVEMSFGMGKDGYPAVNMTQYAALMFCKWLTAKTGIFYRLPTEAEWEYICKKGESEEPLDSIAVYKENSGKKYAKIGTTKADKSGIFDLKGNVAEWTMDQYSDSFYKKSGSDNPWNRPQVLYPRVARGGAWNSPAEACTCSARMASDKKWKQRDPQLPKSRWWLTNAPFVGFRIVRPAKVPSAKEIKEYWLEPIEDYGM
ncbi:MAG: formylglycine-generating enzyme family protein [Cyclobacteriaceae bacterium]|nr:formylglycine-generating enzyme family protein [Cyclobacteriaceae bacterium]